VPSFHTQLSLFNKHNPLDASMDEPSRLQPLRIAALVDGDNISYRLFPEFHERLLTLGELVSCRVFLGSRSPQTGWEKTLAEAGLAPPDRAINVQPTRNATDMRIAMATIELVSQRPDVDTIVLFSADGDFYPVAERLKATGKQVIGFGPQQTSQAFRNACNDFFALSFRLKRKPKSLKPTINAEQVSQLEEAVAICTNGDGWANLSMIGNHLARVAPHLLPKRLGYKSLTKLLSATGRVETKLIESDARSARIIQIKPDSGDSC